LRRLSEYDRKVVLTAAMAAGLMLLKDTEAFHIRGAARWKTYIRRHNKHERKFKRMLQQYFQQQRDFVLGQMKWMPIVADSVIAKNAYDIWLFDEAAWNADLQQRGELAIKDIVKVEGPQVMRELHSELAASGSPAARFRLDFSTTSPELQSFVDSFSLKLAGAVNKTTTDSIRSELAAGIMSGESMDKLRNRVEQVFSAASRQRAQVIARTETTRAMNYSAKEAYRQSGVVMGKQWYTAMDELTCWECSEINEVIVDIEADFAKEGDVMRGPDGQTATVGYSDIEAPPLHPNCRCVLLPVVMEEFAPAITPRAPERGELEKPAAEE